MQGNFMFPVQKHMFSVQKHMFPVQKHKFSGQKHKLPLGTIRFFAGINKIAEEP